MNIIETAEKRDEIMSAMNIYCPICEARQFAPFDKLYTTAFDKCVACTDDADELELNGENIFAILEA